MANDIVFSWAENAEGRMVHVDDVPRGLQCGYCGCYITLGLPKQRVKPDHAEQCPRFRSK